jgi:hypothetical protein
MVRAFRSLGVEILEFDVPSSPDLFRTFIESTKGVKVDALFTLDLGAEDYFIARLLDVQKALDIPFVVWFVDDPEGYGYPAVCDRNRTIAFCWDQGLVDRWSSNGELLILHLPLAADPTLFYPEKVQEPQGGSVGVFVGSTTHPNEFLKEAIKGASSLHGDAEALWQAYSRDFRQSLQSLTWQLAGRKARMPVYSVKKDVMWQLWAHSCLHAVGFRKRVNVVSRILGHKGRVFGDQAWRCWLPEGTYHGRIEYGDPLRRVYNESAFVLETRQSQAQTGPTQRLFDASACAIPVVSEWSSEITAYFQPQEECLCFHTLDEGEEMGRFLIKNKPEARKIGTKAMRRVRAHHGYLNRASHIMESLHHHF